MSGDLLLGRQLKSDSQLAATVSAAERLGADDGNTLPVFDSPSSTTLPWSKAVPGAAGRQPGHAYSIRGGIRGVWNGIRSSPEQGLTRNSRAPASMRRRR